MYTIEEIGNMTNEGIELTDVADYATTAIISYTLKVIIIGN